MDNLPKQGYVTLIPSAEILAQEENSDIKMFVTGWSEPNHMLKSHIAQEPLEDGAVVTDHVIALPVELEMKGYVSDVIHGSQAGTFAWNKIREMHSNEVIMNVITEWGYYASMAIKSVDAKQVNRSLQFTINLMQITRVGISVNVIQNPQSIRQDPKKIAITFLPATETGFSLGESSNKFGPGGGQTNPETTKIILTPVFPNNEDK